jgi:predicted esterase
LGIGVGALVVLLLFAGLACGADDSPARATARFELSAETSFFAQPFPCDLRRRSEGGLDLSGFPDGDVMVNEMVATAAEHSDGYALGGAIYFTFSEPLDPATLPAEGAGSMAPDATVYLVNVDPGSPAYGERMPLWLRSAQQESRFLPANWLALLPFPGVPLQQGTTYAAVVTDGVRTLAGESFARDRDFAALMSGSGGAAVQRARQVFAPLLAYLDDQGMDPERVVNATVFTTHGAAELIGRARAVIYRDLDPPTLQDLSHEDSTSRYDLYVGSYPAPIFQQGEPPYRNSGGQIERDAQGDPVLALQENLRVALAVPSGPMPAAGWPVAIYRHGTGGDYLTFHENGMAMHLAAAKDDEGVVLGSVAVISIDGVVHGPRAGTDTGSPAERFYNFQNPLAGRDNSRQEAIDNFQLVRLAQAVDVAQAPGTGRPIAFDPDHLYFFGHSQGAITGALFLPFEPDLKASLLSGAGAHLLLTLLRKDSEFDIPALLELLLNDGAYGPIDEFHPVLTLVQTYIEPADPLAYGALYLRDPVPGVGPRNVFLTYGVGDSYTPNLTSRALASAIGLAPAGEVFHPYDAMELVHPVSPLSAPVCQNHEGAAGAATAVVVQYQPAGGRDGHFVVFDDTNARRQAAAFLATEAYLGCATLMP